MHQLLFVAFTLVAAVPIVVLAIWEGQTRVSERTGLGAGAAFAGRPQSDLHHVALRQGSEGDLSAGVHPGIDEPAAASLINLLEALEVTRVCILNPDGSVAGMLPGLTDDIDNADPPDPARFKILRALADDMPDEPVLSKLYHDEANRPVFYLVKALPDGKLGVGIVSTRYLVSLQQGISFGDRGHAVITDGSGQVIADPSRSGSRRRRISRTSRWSRP